MGAQAGRPALSAVSLRCEERGVGSAVRRGRGAALGALSRPLDFASRGALQVAGRARLGASDRVGGSRRYKHCSVHCALLETMLQFGVAPPTNKVKGGQRHLQLLLLASLVAAEARVLPEASVHPAQALQGTNKALHVANCHSSHCIHQGADASVVPSHFCREEVSSLLTMRDADSAARPTREGHHGKDHLKPAASNDCSQGRMARKAGRVHKGNGMQQACECEQGFGPSSPNAPTAGSVSPKDGFSSTTKSVELHDATYGIAGNHRKPVRSLCNLRIPSFASAPLGVPDPVVASRRLHIGCALARLADARMLVGTCVKAANLGAVPPRASLPGSLSRSAGIDFVNACQRGLGIVGAGSRRKAESPRPSADSWLPWALRAPWAGYARPVDKRVQCCRSAAPGVGMACGQCRSA